MAPFDPLGALKVSVELAAAPASNEPQDRLRQVRTWFVVGYEDLGRFQARLRQVLAGEADEAVLTSTLG